MTIHPLLFTKDIIEGQKQNALSIRRRNIGNGEPFSSTSRIGGQGSLRVSLGRIGRRKQAKLPQCHEVAFKRERSIADVPHMKTHAALFMWMMFVGTAVTPLRAQVIDEAATRSKILALEHAWDRAVESNDLKGLDSLFDNALVYITQDGTLLTKADFLLSVRAMRLEKVVTESMSVQVFGDTAIVTGVYRSSEFKNGKLILRRGRFLNTWVYKDGSWICVAAEDTPMVQ